MSGFAAVIFTTTDEEPGNKRFSSFLQSVAGYKSLEKPTVSAAGRRCIGAKLDSPSSLHRGITVDPESGSWLIAAGTVVDSHAVSPDGDLHALLKDYVQYGESVLERCDGLFALVIYNGLTRSVALVSDPFGYFSVFYGSRNGRVFIATSALAVAEAIQSAPSDSGVSCFLHTGKVFGEMTLWRDVKRLPAATVLEFVQGVPKESTYWMPSVDQSMASLSMADSLQASVEVLQRTFERNLDREGKVWADLSGGFDSRIVTMVLDQTGIPFKANSVGSPGQPDVEIARTITREMGWEHQIFDVPDTWPQECPRHLKDALGRGDAHLSVFLLAPVLWTHRQKARQYTTLLTGLGGEMWRGPLWWPERRNLAKSTEVHYDRQLWSLMHPVPNSVFVSDASQRVAEELMGRFRRVGDRYPDSPNTVKLDWLWVYRNTSHAGAWASAAVGPLRLLHILFSKEIVPHVISLNHRWKRGNLLARVMFEQYSPTLANIEVEGRGPAAPQRLTNYYRFIPSRIGLYKKALNKVGQIATGRSLWPARTYTSYSRLEWRQGILEFAEAEKLFHPSEMRSGSLYDFEQLRVFLSQAQTEGFAQDEFLGRVITVELALRAVGSATG
jgi:asparagine synthetase B (glutamine-hydrolysing)